MNIEKCVDKYALVSYRIGSQLRLFGGNQGKATSCRGADAAIGFWGLLMTDQDLIAQIDGFDKSLPLIENLKWHIEKMNADPDCTSNNLSLRHLWDIANDKGSAANFCAAFQAGEDSIMMAIQTLAQAAWYHRKQKLAEKDKLAHWQCRASRAESAISAMVQIGEDVLENKSTIIDGITMEELPIDFHPGAEIGDSNCKGAWELGTACGECRRCRLTVMEFAKSVVRQRKTDKLAKSISELPFCEKCKCTICMCKELANARAAHTIGESIVGDPSNANFANTPSTTKTFHEIRGLNPDGTVQGHQPEDRRFQ